MVIKGTKLSGGDIVYVNGVRQTVADREQIAARLQNAVNMWLGEFELEPLVGVDWYLLLNGPGTTGPIKTAITRVLQDDPDFLEIVSFNLDFDRSTSTISGTFSVRTTAGEGTIEIGQE
jgi:hypothetical protein